MTLYHSPLPHSFTLLPAQSKNKYYTEHEARGRTVQKSLPTLLWPGDFQWQLAAPPKKNNSH